MKIKDSNIKNNDWQKPIENSPDNQVYMHQLGKIIHPNSPTPIGRIKEIYHTDRGDIHFTSREKQCIYYLAAGNTMKKIAKILQLSPRTVESYLNKIKLKTGCRSKKELIAFIKRNGLLD